MSIFPTRILVATDGSREAELAVTTAADLAKSTDSELHVVHVGEVPLVYHPERHAYLSGERVSTTARVTGATHRGSQCYGGTSTPEDGQGRRRDCRVGPKHRCRVDSDGQQRAWEVKEGACG
jgi:hypothetical protein